MKPEPAKATSIRCPIHLMADVLVQLDQDADPWFLFSQLLLPKQLCSETLELFRRRNVFVSASVLDNRYELRQTLGAKPGWFFQLKPLPEAPQPLLSYPRCMLPGTVQ